jgi:pimeloyl-ACP methyl ester carboxylesterase
MTPLVLVHGGGLDSRCWDLLLPHLDGPAIAVDLPGRGRHPAPLESVTVADCARAVVVDVDAAGFDELVLVGHSLAGVSMPAVVGLLGNRVHHAVFVACTVPADGTSCFDTLDPDIQERGRAASETGDTGEPRAMDAAMAKIVLGDDLDDAQFAWCVERLVPEAPGLTQELVDLSPFREHTAMSRTWIRTTHDIIVSPEKQQRFAGYVGDCTMIDLDFGHMCMVGQPDTTAAILNRIAG